MLDVISSSYSANPDTTAPILSPRIRRYPVYDWWVELGPSAIQPTREAIRKIRELQRMTSWSDRRIARTLGTTHPTVAALRHGRGGKVPLRSRLVRVHDLVSRIYALCGEEPDVTDRVLETAGENGVSAFDLLTRDDVARAYLLALDVSHGRPMEVFAGTRRRVGDATASLVDED